MLFVGDTFFIAVKNSMRSVFIWCFCQWMGEEAEDGDSGSRDSDCDCDCVVEWWWGENSLELVAVCWWGGGQ